MQPDVIDPEMQIMSKNRLSGFNYRERREPDWRENYSLYRDKVRYNRLTQRQSVNVPLMKYQIRTLLKDVDDMPVLYFENLDNDQEAEVYENEYWKETVAHNRMELQDIIDKRQVMLFGRSYDQWQVIDGKVTMTIQDPADILVSRYVDPFNIHSSRFLIHHNIFVPLTSLRNNPDYDQGEVTKLIKWHATDQGLIKAAENEQAMQAKAQKLEDLGISDADMPILGETYVELSLHFIYMENQTYKDKEGNDQEYPEQIFMFVEADQYAKLMKKPLEEVIGETKDHYWQNHYPYNSWADDLERQDWYSDGVGDIIRGPNIVVNTFYSQEIENRTLSNLNMNVYDSTVEGFVPQTWEPKAFGWYGVPGKPADVYQQLKPTPLNGNMDTMQFVIGISEKASGATATQQGVQSQKQITLGEVQLALGEAKERVKGMSKFYTPAWEQRGIMFTKIVEAAHDKLDPCTIHKKGRFTNNIYSKTIEPKDWMTKMGSRVKVWSRDEKDAQDTQALEKASAVKANMPDNPKVDEIYKRKLVEFAGFTPDEINEVMAFEEQKQQAMMSMVGQPGGLGMPGMPADPALGGGAPAPAPQAPVMPQMN